MSNMAEISPLIITYNCGRELVKPTIFSNHIVSAFPQISPELIVVALEEVAPIAYSFLAGSFLTSYLDRIRRTVDLTARKWGDYTYDDVLTRNLGMTALMVFARSDVKQSIVSVEAGGVGVGYQEMGNKGAVAVRLGFRNGAGDVVGVTFVAAHLAPMEDAVERRNEDWKQIVRGLTLSPAIDGKPKTEASPTDIHATDRERQPLLQDEDGNTDKEPRGMYSAVTSDDRLPASHLIVAGDLNYRTANRPPRPYARAGFPQLAADSNSPHHHSKLLPSDQLTGELASRKTLHGLVEAPITFPPTYKYSNTARRQMATLEDGDLKPGARRDEGADIGLDIPAAPLDFPWAGHRWPSWCDRILWLPASSVGVKDEIVALRYTSLNLMSTSDHQPVVLHLKLPLERATPSDGTGPRTKPPFELDPTCESRRIVARRKEIATGAAALVFATTEGRAFLAAILVGVVGGWAIVSSFLA